MIKLKKNPYINYLLNTKDYLNANIITKLIKFLLIPIKTRLLTPADYGILSIVTSFQTILNVFFNMNFYGGIIRYYHEEKDDFLDFFKSSIIYIYSINIFFLLILFIFRNFLIQYLGFSIKLYWITIYISFISIPQSFFFSYLMASKRSKTYSYLMISISLVVSFVSILWMFLLKENRYLGDIYARLLLLSIITVLILIYIFFKLKGKIVINFNYIKYLIFFGIPLIPHALSGIILMYFDRLIINNIDGFAKAGVYSFAYNIGLIMYITVNSFNKAWNPVFYEKMNKKEYNSIEYYVKKNIKIIYFIALILILFSNNIIGILANKNYLEAIYILPMIILSYVMVFNYMIFVAFSFYEKRTYIISINSIIAAIINIILNYIYIPKYGYIAASYTTLFSYIVLFLLHYIFVRFKLKYNIIKFSTVYIPFIILILFVAISVVIQYFLYLTIIIEIMVKSFILLLYFVVSFYYLIKKVRKKYI